MVFGSAPRTYSRNQKMDFTPGITRVLHGNGLGEGLLFAVVHFPYRFSSSVRRGRTRCEIASASGSLNSTSGPENYARRALPATVLRAELSFRNSPSVYS